MSGNRLDIYTGSDQQRCVCVAQAVDRYRRQIGSCDEIMKPACHGIRMDRFACPLLTKCSVAKHKLPKTCYIGTIGRFFFDLSYTTFDNCTSLATVETSVITTVQAAAFVSFGGLLFEFVQRKMGYSIGWFALVLVIIGFIIVGCASDICMWYVGVVLFKLGFCWWMAYENFLVNDGTDETNSALATSLCFISNSFGNFIFAYVFAFIGTLLGGISQHHGFLYGCVCVAVALVLVAVNHFKNYNHYQKLA